MKTNGADTQHSKAPERVTDEVRQQPLIGRIAVVTEASDVFVLYPVGSTDPPVAARISVDVSLADVGREAVLVFEDGNPFRPVVVGLLPPLLSKSGECAIRIEAGADRLVLEAETEVVLRCGEASITLTRDGRVTIRGASLLSRSSGPNRIKGASVQIN